MGMLGDLWFIRLRRRSLSRSSRMYGHLSCAPVEYSEDLPRDNSHLLRTYISMDYSRESEGCCEYQVTLWDELFEHSSSVEAWLNDDFLQNRLMWPYPDFLQLHHFLAEDCFCDDPRTSFHNMCGEPQSLHEIGANHLKTFQRRYVRRHSEHRWESRPGSRNAPGAVSCLTLKVTINLVFLKPAYFSRRPWSSASASLLLLNHLSKLDLSSQLVLNRGNLRIEKSTAVFVTLLEKISGTWGSLDTMCVPLPQKPMQPIEFLWPVSLKLSTGFTLQPFLLNACSFRVRMIMNQTYFILDEPQYHISTTTPR